MKCLVHGGRREMKCVVHGCRRETKCVWCMAAGGRRSVSGAWW